MISNWKYWTFLVLMPIAVVIYDKLPDTPWRILVFAGLGMVYGAFFAGHRKRLVEVPRGTASQDASK